MNGMNMPGEDLNYLYTLNCAWWGDAIHFFLMRGMMSTRLREKWPRRLWWMHWGDNDNAERWQRWRMMDCDKMGGYWWVVECEWSNDDEWMLMTMTSPEKNHVRVEGAKRKRRLGGSSTSTSTSTSASTPSTTRFSMRFCILGMGRIVGYVLKFS